MTRRSRLPARLPTAVAITIALAACAAPVWAATPEAVAAAADAYFARPPAIRAVEPSPNGKRLALIVPGPPNGRDRLAVMDLAPRGKPRIVAGYKDADVDHLRWVNDDRIVFDVIDKSEGLDVRFDGAGSFAVNHDGSDLRLLAALRDGNFSTGTSTVSRVLNYRWSLLGPVADGGDEVWAREWREDLRGNFSGYVWARLDTRNGRLYHLDRGMPDHATRYLPGTNGGGVVQTAHGGRTRLEVRADGKSSWKLLQDEDYVNGHPYEPLHLQNDGLAWVERLSPDGFLALYGLDTSTGEVSAQPLVAVKGFDLGGSLELDGRARRVVGVHFRTDRRQTHWLDESLAQIQQSVDRALPADRSNRLLCGNCETTPYLVVSSVSDQQPGEYYLYDRTQRKLELLGAQRPWIDEARQGRRSMHRVKARDGLEFPVYLTHPAGRHADERLPAVLLVHGGPHVRGADVGWTAEAQFLASLGYRVIEPEFRGSAGYGAALLQAGMRQWGTGMIDDLHDALRWAVAQGGVDEQRVCVMGASYGGYAALMSTIRHPGAYRCAVSFAGVTDITLHYQAWGSDLSDESRRYRLPASTGNPATEGEFMRSISPLQRAAEIKVPVLLSHGLLDRRVTVEQADKFRAAAQKAGVALSYLPFEKEGHGFLQPGSEALYYRRVGEFLAQHLDATAAPAAAPR